MTLKAFGPRVRGRFEVRAARGGLARWCRTSALRGRSVARGGLAFAGPGYKDGGPDGTPRPNRVETLIYAVKMHTVSKHIGNYAYVSVAYP